MSVNTEELYAEDHYELVDTRHSLFGKLIAFDDKIVLHELQRIGTNDKDRSILDFGCGKGVFLDLAKRRGWRVKGIETARHRADFARSAYGLDVDSETYSRGRVTSGPFDVITLFHVLEHLPNPCPLIQELIDMNLKPDGVLVVEVPRFDSWQSVFAGSHWLHLDPPRHLSHFTTKKLSAMLQSLGFKIVARGQFSIHNSIIGMVQALLNKLGYRKMLIEELKLRRSLPLLLSVLAVLPPALMLELLAVLFNRGGIVRLYCIRTQTTAASDNAKLNRY